MMNVDYFDKFKNLVDVIKQYIGCLGNNPGAIGNKLD